jgi:hypothetical protein
MSLYLFNLCMDILTRMLEYNIQLRSIKGIQLARGAPCLTNLMFTDDLILLGKEDLPEALTISNILHIFCSTSGQKVGPAKSKIWFSKATQDGMQNLIIQIFMVPKVRQNEMYLGAHLLASQHHHFSTLMNRIYLKLNSWKIHLLSHTGRLVLINMVIKALALYTMSTTLIPKGLLTQISGLMKRFFWNKMDSGRYMPLISWDVVTLDKDERGLEIRDLACLNDALMVKLLCRLVQQDSTV